MSEVITVIKRDYNSQPILNYPAKVLSRDDTSMCVEAWFSRESVDIGFFTFNIGDRMVEWFYTDRYYNVFRVHDGDTNTIKGWYCNITRPAEISTEAIAADDLALDVVVMPDGSLHLLDEDDYNALDLSHEEQTGVEAALANIRVAIKFNLIPFDRVTR